MEIAAWFYSCCYFSEIRVKRKVTYFRHTYFCQKQGNENRPEEQVFLIPGPPPTVILPLQLLLSFESVSFLHEALPLATLLGSVGRKLKLLSDPARITKPLPHIRAAAIS